MLGEEERDLAQMLQTSNSELPSLIVISTHAPEAEKPLQSVEYIDIAFVLNDAKFRYDLVADLDRWVSLDAYEEATFSVDESNHPIRVEFHRDCQLLTGCSAYRL